MSVATITPADFVKKWSQVQQKERSIYQTHLIDLCRLVGHPAPLEMDPGGSNFVFEMQAGKPEGERGFADVFFRGHFIMEYKGPHKDLDRAYQQLQLYREALDNPPLLITSDTQVIHIHTNFTNRPTEVVTVTLGDIAAGPGVATLRRVFSNPDSFMPERTREVITQASANSFLAVADHMKQHQRLTGEDYSAEQLAHFLVRLLFCLFAEDLNLLPDKVFTETVRRQSKAGDDLRHMMRALFAAMRDGGTFGFSRIRHFNGTLFDDEFVPTMPTDLALALLRAAEQDWSGVDPSIFGTIFERVIDPGKRAQLGAHYTSREDIMLIVEPVLMEPLRREWDDVRRSAAELPDAQAHATLAEFADRLAATRVLDPACGSGNFLYLALRQLLDLQKEVIAFAARKGLPDIPLTVSPQQLYGIEINPYAHELAQITAWIGYLQWRTENGFTEMDEPILKPLHNIRHMDAILAYDADGRPVEPTWPEAEVIIGNPPFLGGNKIRQELGDAYVDSLFKLYNGRIPAFADLVCYWFEKARAKIEAGTAQRAGLIATNSIRGGANRVVLERIKQTGDIFMAWSDNPWVLDGAAVRVSIVGFDNGYQTDRKLNGSSITEINSDLTASIDLTKALRLHENFGIAYSGTKKGGPFDISKDQASSFLRMINGNPLRKNSDVIKPWINGREIIGRPQEIWIIDFGNRSENEAAEYEGPYKYVKEQVLPIRAENRRAVRRERWWLHSELAPALMTGIAGKTRYIVTPRVAKHRIFIWASKGSIPDDGIYGILRDDDYFFGVLHARPHEIWSLRLGTWLGKGNDPRYTPTTTFETYPFPWPPGQEPAEADDPRVAAIAGAARRLVAWRDAWLNPPPDEAAYLGPSRLKARTLTNLYNGLVYFREQPGPAFDRAAFDKETRKSVSRAEVEELDDIHRALDAAVFRAYGWADENGRAETLTDEQLLGRLLALNLARAAASG